MLSLIRCFCPDAIMSWAYLERGPKKTPNQDFELWETSFNFPVPHKGGARANKDPNPEPPRCFVRDQWNARD